MFIKIDIFNQHRKHISAVYGVFRLITRLFPILCIFKAPAEGASIKPGIPGFDGGDHLSLVRYDRDREPVYELIEFRR